MEKYLSLDCPLFYPKRPMKNKVSLKVDTEKGEFTFIDTTKKGYKEYKISVSNEQFIDTNTSNLSLLEKKIIFLENLFLNMKVNSGTTVTSINDLKATTDELVINIEESIKTTQIIEGKSITITNLKSENSNIILKSSGDITIKNLQSSGVLNKNVSNAQFSINTNEYVKISNSELNQKSYNAIEIGLNNTAPKSILIDNVNITGELSNNGILIFDTQDNAEITISNCTINKCSNPIRLSNKSGNKLTLNLINCNFIEWDRINPDYTGCILCQDYTSKTIEEAQQKNLFSPEKITINFINCTHKGKKIMFNNIEDVCYTKNFETQLIYVYTKEGCVNFDKNRYPNITCK